VDAQGRFTGETLPDASNATLLAYLDQWQQQCQENAGDDLR
jgi:hypothetical protein